jgi:4-hydroxy-2-oxoheptanedioate aldolase
VNENKTKAKLGRGEPVYGVISSVSDPMIAEMIGVSGFDFYMVDGEHGPVTPAQAVHIVRACETVDITPLVRIGQKDAKLALQYLDAGMMGVMMPGLETAAEVEMLVSAVKYPPMGKRGLGYARTADYLLGASSIAEYVDFANEHTMVLPQFEDVALLDRLPKMAAVAGVDGFVIGPVDLSLSMGFPEGPGHPDVQSVIDQAIDAIRRAGLFAGITAATAVVARNQIERGALMILNSVPNLIGMSGRAFLATAGEN